MDLKVPYAQVTDKKTAYDAAKKLIPEVISKFGVKAETKLDDQFCLIEAKGSGFTAQIRFEESGAHVSVDLNFLLRPLKGKILETIEKQIKKVV